jgi:hypothetical protein
MLRKADRRRHFIPYFPSIPEEQGLGHRAFGATSELRFSGLLRVSDTLLRMSGGCFVKQTGNFKEIEGA